MFIRKARRDDAEILRELYHMHLTENPPERETKINDWKDFIANRENDPFYNIFVAEESGKAVSTVTAVIVPNLTHGSRPYCVIENVVTHADFRGQGYATALIARAVDTARGHGCYKVMLMTGSKKVSTLDFYERCGFSRTTKTAFDMRL